VIEGKVSLQLSGKASDFEFSQIVDDCRLLNSIAEQRRKLRINDSSLQMLLKNKQSVFTLDPTTHLPQSF
jgi:hypothetical protein